MTRGSFSLPPHLFVLLLCVLAGLPAGCSKKSSAAAVNEDAPVRVQTSTTLLTFENRAGLPLTDLSIAIVPYARTEFVRNILRVESSEKRQIPLNEFRSRDGTVFNLRAVRPKSVRVRARDATGKKYEVEMPWQ